MKKQFVIIYTYRCVDDTIDNGKITVSLDRDFKETKKNTEKLTRILEARLKLPELKIHGIIGID